MKFSMRTIAFVLGLPLAAQPAIAEDEAYVDNVEGWSILRDVERSGCVMEKVNENGFLFRIGKT